MNATETRTHDQVRAIIAENRVADRPTFARLTSAEISAHNRRLMFGENDEGFPSASEWSAWVD